MHTLLFGVAALSAVTAVSAVGPYTPLPLGNGFPNPSMKAIAKIEMHAGGSLPNGALPTKLTPTAAATFQVLGTQEIFETAFFTQLLKNITNSVPGYKTSGREKKYLMRTFRRIRAQEELHALGINAILENAGEQTVGACRYNFPVTTLAESIDLAKIFTDVVLGVLPSVQQLVAEDGSEETGLISLIGSIQGQEAEQVGYFRSYEGKPPSAAPFLTGGAGQFAYSVLKNMFIVPGSCSFEPDVPTFPLITVINKPTAHTKELMLEVEGAVDASEMSVVYLSGQNLPVVVPITGVKKMGKMTQFKAKFPFDQGFARGLTIAAVTKGKKQLSSADAVAEAAVYGPGLIEVG